MSLLITSILVAAVYAAVSWLVQRMREIGGSISYQVDPKYKPSEQDQQLISQSKDLVRSHFGDNIAQSLLPLTPQQRAERVTAFTQELIEQYNLDIDRLSIGELDDATKGGYSIATNSILLNIKYLTLDDEEELKDFIDTIIHECKHALQHRMVQHPEEYAGGPAELERWRRNFEPGCYIRPEYDPKGYWEQPVEFDARNFAASVVGTF